MNQQGQPYRKLYRSRTDCQIEGVCGGLGAYFSIDPVIFRILFVIAAFMGSAGFIAYIILCFIIPKEPKQKRPRKNAANVQQSSADDDDWENF